MEQSSPAVPAPTTRDRGSDPDDRSTSRGRSAERPRSIPGAGWKDIALRTKAEAKSDNLALLAAGVAFFALLSLVPALVALMSIYGIVADPADVERQVTDSLAAAPTEVQDLLSEQLTSVTEQSGSGLGLTAAGAILLALWSASSGMKHLMTAINVAYDEDESRGFVALRGRALLLTVGAVAFAVVAIGTITVLPALLADAGLGQAGRTAVSLLRWPLLGVGLALALAVLYRYAPDRDEPRWTWTAPGTIVAVVLWLLASIGFSIYTSNFGSYGETYGSLGAVIVLMLWLMISAAVIIIGAELNAETERQTAVDTTKGDPQPMGERDAHAADTLGS